MRPKSKMLGREYWTAWKKMKRGGTEKSPIIDLEKIRMKFVKGDGRAKMVCMIDLRDGGILRERGLTRVR